MTERQPHRSPRCGAKTRAGTPCELAPMIGKRRCYRHGGASPDPGPSHPNYKHGRWSKAFGRFSHAVDAALVDADLLDPTRGVAAAQGALEAAGERLAERDTPQFRERMLVLLREVLDLIPTDPQRAVGRLRDAVALAEGGVAEDAAFALVVQRAESYSRAVNDALRLRMQASTAMSVQDLVLHLDGIVQLILEVSGRDAALEIMHRFDRERLRGKLAQSGFMLGARAITEQEEESG